MCSHLLVCTCLKAYKTLYARKSAALNFLLPVVGPAALLTNGKIHIMLECNVNPLSA